MESYAAHDTRKLIKQLTQQDGWDTQNGRVTKKWQLPNVMQQQKARVETTIDWAQVMTKIIVSCAIAPLYENVEC